MSRRKPSDRAPVPEEYPEELPEDERRPARMRLVAGRRLVGLRVVLDGLHDPHNISAVLRSSEGFGLQHVHLLGMPLDLPTNKAITKGCEKWLSLHYHATAAACAEALHAEGFALWAAMPDRSAPILDDIDFTAKVALVFGAERDGVSPQLLAQCDRRYQIPMPGFSQSLNVSVAAAISLYVAARARRKAVGGATDQTSDESDALGRKWIDDDNARKRWNQAAQKK